MSVMLGPLEPEVDNPTVGKRTLDFTGFMDASEFAEIQASVSRMLHIEGMRASF